MLAALLALAALAAPPTDRPVTLSGGLTQLAGPGAVGGGVQGRAVFHVGAASVEVGSREALLAGSGVALGSITAGARWTSPAGPHLRAAFLHHHETPLDLAGAHPVQTTLGSLPGISHRSGLELGAGVDLPMLKGRYEDRMGLGLDLAVGAFPDKGGPVAYVFLEQSVTFDVGRRRHARDEGAPTDAEIAESP